MILSMEESLQQGPPSQTLLPIPVTLATHVVEVRPGFVRLMETGVGQNLCVIVSMTINNQIQINFCCLAVDCGSLDASSNGAVDTTSGTTFMMTATYTCNTGYTLVGTVTRTCQANTMWSLSAPTCTGMPRVVVKCIDGTL